MATPSDSVSAWLSTVLAADHSRLVEALAMVERDDDDAIHQVRVACRRARSHVRTFAAPLDAEWADDLARRLRRLAGSCGDARDLEVLREHTSGYPSLEVEVAELERAALATARRQLDRPRTAKTVAALRSAADDARALSGEPAQEVLPELVRSTWQDFEKAAGRLTLDSPDSDWHRARVRAKRARYTAEAAAPVLGEETASLAARAKQVQALLGEHQDLVMTAELLQPIGTDAARALAEAQHARRPELRRRFLTCWADEAGTG